MRNFKKSITYVLSFLCLTSAFAGELTTGIGYINPEDYRVDNDINSLPLGTSVLPLISYRTENFQINGVNMSYHLLKGPIGFKVDFNVVGDRYKSHEVEERKSTANLGATFRIFFVSFKYGSDIFNVYKGNKMNITIAQPFHIFDKVTLIPRVGREFLNASYTNYYFGVRNDEVGEYQAYEMDSAANTILGLTTVIKLSQSSNLTFNLNHKKFDKVIHESPTVSKRSYNVFATFLGFKY